MLPVGLKGLIAAAMLAAAMQTCSAALNSTATLFSYDIVKRWKPDTTDHKLVVIGKITTIAATILAIVLSPIFGHYSTIIEGLNKLISYIAPPITTVFLLGVFWKKSSGKAAFITLISGAVLGLVIFYLDWNGIFVSNFMMTAFYLLVLCFVIMITSSFMFPEPLKEEAKILVWENWKEPLKGEAKGFVLGNYKILSAAVFITFILLYYVFR